MKVIIKKYPREQYLGTSFSLSEFRVYKDPSNDIHVIIHDSNREVLSRIDLAEAELDGTRSPYYVVTYA